MLDELKTFIAVVDYNNFTHAALHLNISQPTVSTHIKNLESLYETKLIIRSVHSKQIIITDSGYFLYQKAKEILKLVNQSQIGIHSNSQTLSGHLKIGASLTIGECFLPRILASFSAQYPDITYEVTIENTECIVEKVKKMKIDIGLIEGMATASDFQQHYFSEDEMVLIFSPISPLNSCPFSSELLSKQCWLARESGSGTRAYLDLFLSKNKVVPKSFLVLGSNGILKESVKNNLGISLISKQAVANELQCHELSMLPLPEVFKRQYSYILPLHANLDPILKVFIDALINC